MRRFTSMIVLGFSAGALMGSPAICSADSVGKVTHLSGLLTAKRLDGSTKVISVKSDIQEGDTLSTQRDTYARMKFADGAEVVLRPGTQLQVKAYSYNQEKPEADNVLISLFKGGMRAVTGLIGKRSRNSVKFATSSATIGIRGTHFGALICNNDCGGVNPPGAAPPSNGLHVDVASGAVSLNNSSGQQQVVSSGQFGYVANDTTAPTVVPPQQGVIVSMPVAISKNKTNSQGVSKPKEGECPTQ